LEQAEAAAATASAESETKENADSHVLVEITQALTEFLDEANTQYLYRTIGMALRCTALLCSALPCAVLC
jgi:hypothetical protein